MIGNEEVSERVRTVMFQYVFDEEKVIQRLTHLFRVNGNKAVVYPIVDHRAVIATSFGLCDFIFMVREYQVTAATVKIKGFTQVF